MLRTISRTRTMVPSRHLISYRFFSDVSTTKGETFTLTKHFLDASNTAHIAVYSLNRPEAMNSISKKLLEEFETYINSLAAEGRHQNVTNTRALILSSELPKVFCAGADLKERKTFTDADTAAFLNKLNGTLDTIQSLHMPTITAIQGFALGGGAEISLATDFRVLSDVAQFGLPETRLAILPGAGGTKRLPKLIGYSRALDLVLTGRRVKADEALHLGIANRTGENALETALEMAKLICEGGPIAINAAKMAVRGQSKEWEIAAYNKVVNSEDKFEALSAFKEKRKPIFKGR
ncbi:ClpP/crotonase-like domain-containing protein [Yarrowia lipolytica]|uniref:YALI0F22121p n=2 Tax=Yarrowia lipolytica TaxID=4952 RepID=Q6C0S5_YARLI|nr:YALI0F22121p [Yarrowia lipolytica CLIB122]AOW07551.1 hypothetical protein YALI1_F29301g [Yarrowia lipolytica]KAB8281301.1 ClpP/crotonase-like domain-containing protein [Yarrowia lipolytica]KAE8170597.1 ClpP/crotonase-like domain-containing protein [Yarrowia lipolytica]KAJ8055380.1 ClpP/crotonase-like domain-containing protein [Yarrowia lipolytica]QNP99359.1 Putative enoyl-CoA hydratase 2 [Yarrowia lipolytica]|eukprot:XP_505737.1 YALI0F22121p [Yarrowia lipolytica CLIB122]